MLSKLLVVACLLAVVNADMYLQFPRGSNNRLNEDTRTRNNANRLFDSQNNNRGGYNVGNVYFYTGTTMNMEWTNQHSCGGPNNHCEIILQYTCDPRVRDGATTTTIPETAGADGNPTFGRHESYQYYSEQCKWRQRNRGLFTANRALQGQGAIYTRQNENGQRYGFECPEERDYYPYWHPTMWRDIAIFTNQPSRCQSYVANSQNVAERYYCKLPQDYIQQQASQGRTGFIPINATQCAQIRSLYEVDEYNNTIPGQWVFVPSFNIPPPLCSGQQFSRDNHLGNGIDGFPNGFNWTIPADIISERCVVRIRYNISTGEYAAFADANSVTPPANLTARYNNSITNPTANRDPAYVDIWSKYGLAWNEVNVSFSRTTNDPNGAAIKNSRDYVLKDNPKVDMFGSLIPKTQSGDPTQPAMIRLQLAINTDQFGRTFEDRSHRFAIRQKPSELDDIRVHNLQVKGKRGNIVQNFPATEYDFWPKRLKVQNGEYIHFQWTGSNNNGDNNAGRGKAGTDRHNVLLLRAPVYPYLQAAHATANARPGAIPTVGALGSTYPSRINLPNNTFLGFGYNDLKSLATWSTYQFGGDLDQGDDAGTYFDLGPRPVTLNGIFNYACSRNNDFSNRDQKATIIVSTEAAVFQSLGSYGGTLTADSGASVEVQPGALTSQVTISLLTASPHTASSFSGSVASDYVTIIPLVLPLAPGATIRINVPYDNKPLIIPQLYRSDSINGDWSTVDASYSGGVASADVTRGGTYVVQTQVNWGGVVGVIVGAVGFVGIVVGVMYWRAKKQAAGGATDAGGKKDGI